MRSRIFFCSPWSVLVLACLAGAAPVGSAQGSPGVRAGFALVPEMEPPAGILYQDAERRLALQEKSGARRGLAVFEARVRASWPQLADVDLFELSRYQVEATRGFRWPDEPGELEGEAVGWDRETGLWHLELRGPRLPARYEIVHRHLYFYATFDPSTEELGALTVTIRGWVLE